VGHCSDAIPGDAGGFPHGDDDATSHFFFFPSDLFAVRHTIHINASLYLSSDSTSWISVMELR
jgi:hypothetical protein